MLITQSTLHIVNTFCSSILFTIYRDLLYRETIPTNLHWSVSPKLFTIWRCSLYKVLTIWRVDCIHGLEDVVFLYNKQFFHDRFFNVVLVGSPKNCTTFWSTTDIAKVMTSYLEKYLNNSEKWYKKCHFFSLFLNKISGYMNILLYFLWLLACTVVHKSAYIFLNYKYSTYGLLYS